MLNALVGALGLRPTLAALRAGARLALANKESLIAGGPLVLKAAAPGRDRARRLRALGDRAVPAGGTRDEVAGGAHRIGWTVPGLGGRRLGARHLPNRPAPIPPGRWGR